MVEIVREALPFSVYKGRLQVRMFVLVSTVLCLSRSEKAGGVGPHG